MRQRRSHEGRGANIKAKFWRKIATVFALVSGILVSGLFGMNNADAVGVSAASTAAVVSPSHVIALVLLLILFFVTAGLVGLFWYHLIDSQSPRRGNRRP
ncbi:MAG: hypothetical protein AAGF86_17110 [Pseudomonadota bacterium]